MATVIFDTYKAVRQLRAAGFDETQAAAMVSTICDVLGGNLATKEDIQDMATKADIKDMATKEDIASVRREMATKADLHTQETRLTIRMGGMIFGGIGLVLAIMRLFPDFFG